MLESGVQFALDVAGPEDAPPLVLLHALGCVRTDWLPVLPRLSGHFRVLSPDLRGHGESGWVRPYTLAVMAQDVSQMLDALGLTNVTLLGHSMGAVVSYKIALQRPELVQRLIIEDAPPPYERERAVPAREGNDPLDFDWDVVPAIVKEVNAGDRDSWERLSTIPAPTLIVAGGNDSHIPQNTLEEVARRMPNASLVTIPVGHHVHKAAPEAFVDEILTWLHGT